ncbi:MAG: FecR domain-containing protein [Chitinophagaceae bacterium]
MDTPERIWFLISRNLSGDATPEEGRELMQALQQQPGLSQQYELLHRLWKPVQPAEDEAEESEKINHILQLSANEAYMEETGTSRTSIVQWKKVYRWAAVLAGISISIWAFSYWRNTAANSSSDEIVAQRGSKTRTILPDGSTVWLNAGSHIYYDRGFAGRYREVTLQGEAYFDVIKQPEKPFIVHAGDLNITVLGTAFNVKSYPEDKNTETTLLRGLVQITRKNGNGLQPIYLHPNQKIVLPKTLPPAELAPSAVKKTQPLALASAHIEILDSSLHENERFETAWIYNRLEFRGDDFEELAIKLERWYNISIRFRDEGAKKLVFNGSLENETVEQAFTALQAAVPFNFEIQGNEIYIKSPG